MDTFLTLLFKVVMTVIIGLVLLIPAVLFWCPSMIGGLVMVMVSTLLGGIGICAVIKIWRG